MLVFQKSPIPAINFEFSFSCYNSCLFTIQRLKSLDLHKGDLETPWRVLWHQIMANVHMDLEHTRSNCTVTMDKPHSKKQNEKWEGSSPCIKICTISQNTIHSRFLSKYNRHWSDTPPVNSRSLWIFRGSIWSSTCSPISLFFIIIYILLYRVDVGVVHCLWVAQVVDWDLPI